MGDSGLASGAVPEAAAGAGAAPLPGAASVPAAGAVPGTSRGTKRRISSTAESAITRRASSWVKGAMSNSFGLVWTKIERKKENI